jgi:hypothetical protein
MESAQNIKKMYIKLFKRFLKAKNETKERIIAEFINKYNCRIGKEMEELNKLIFIWKRTGDIEHYKDENEFLRSKITREDIKCFLAQLK